MSQITPGNNRLWLAKITVI